VRVTHLPTGFTAESRSERSQHKNNATALKLLQARLFVVAEDRRQAQRADPKGRPAGAESVYDEKGDVLRSSPIRSYVLHPCTRANDSRTGVETADVAALLDGVLGPFLRAAIRRRAGRPSADPELSGAPLPCYTPNQHAERLFGSNVKEKLDEP
jgi:peptide chain release factor 2